ncbi:MAG: carboxypeptidase regulatory-like domain-containing protein [Planctomycetes bacterium]|nr:carboxypeptidase regulatory-like domain-containing protein [Planctomycetota bacterium]
MGDDILARIPLIVPQPQEQVVSRPIRSAVDSSPIPRDRLIAPKSLAGRTLWFSSGACFPMTDQFRSFLSAMPLWVTIVVVATVVSGCSKPNQQPTWPVTGSIEYDGKPLVGATVVFHAIDKTNFKWKELPQAFTDAEGRFSVRTYTSADGAPAGEYSVGVAMVHPTSDEGDDQPRRIKGATVIPLKYADPSTSGIRVTVERKKTDLPPIRLVP